MSYIEFVYKLENPNEAQHCPKPAIATDELHTWLALSYVSETFVTLNHFIKTAFSINRDF